ncbi:hypothetical protein [Nonomuraea roseola]|uniref:Band 7 domain-containing protein n=1 Tax=Nonomuraea roseola TaxID=46179 RepID=A0ABV5PUK6_9ACTN
MSRLSQWFSAKADHVHLEFIPDPGSRPLVPREGYVRLWLTEGFLGQRRSWGNDHFPALHGGLTLNFLGTQPVGFKAVSTPAWSTPGVHLDLQVSPLVPYNGGVVTVEAGLYQVTQQGPLGAAVQVLGKLAGLVGPPLATAATIAEKMSEGLEVVLEATGDQPRLGVHWSMVAPGGGGRPVQAGHLVVLDAPAPPGRLEIVEGRLRADGRPVLLDYLVLRVECREERDDPITPELEQLIRRAVEDGLHGNTASMNAIRTEAIVRAWTSSDLVPKDQRRVALLIRDEIDAARPLGVVPVERLAARMVSRESPELKGLRLEELISGPTRRGGTWAP